MIFGHGPHEGIDNASPIRHTGGVLLYHQQQYRGHPRGYLAKAHFATDADTVCFF